MTGPPYKGWRYINNMSSWPFATAYFDGYFPVLWMLSVPGMGVNYSRLLIRCRLLTANTHCTMEFYLECNYVSRAIPVPSTHSQHEKCARVHARAAVSCRQISTNSADSQQQPKLSEKTFGAVKAVFNSTQSCLKVAARHGKTPTA